MKSFLNIDKKTRFLVLHLDADMKVSHISKILKVPLSTLYDWVASTGKDEDIRKIKPGRGAKPKIDTAKDKQIQREIHEAPQRSSLRKIGGKFEVGKTAVGDWMHKKGYKYKKRHLEVELEDEEKEDRVDFCEYMLEEGGWRIDQTIFTDEMGIKLSEASPSMGWGKPGKKLKTSQPRKDIKLNCWGGISRNGSTSLYIFQKTLNSDRYKMILEEHLPEIEDLYSEEFIFQHDNLPAHKPLENWIENQGLERVDFPAYSADLSPIENLWSALKHSVAVDHPTTSVALERSLKDNWEKLTTPENLAPYFDNLHNRYVECIDIEGEKVPH